MQTEQKNKRNKQRSSNDNSKFLFILFRIFLHLFALLHHWYAVYYFFEYVNIPETEHRMGNKFGGKFKYLTFLNIILQAIYFTVSFIHDLIGNNKILYENIPKFRSFKDYLFSTLAYPLCINVGVIFWILYAIDRELVLPKSFDPYFPVWLNHMLHTNILIFIFMEFFMSFRIYPKRLSGVQTLTIFLLCYLVWIHVIKHFSGIWVYPVLDVFNFQQRIAFFISIILWSIFAYFTGEFLNNLIWSKEIQLVKQKINQENYENEEIFGSFIVREIE